jgi:alpha-D-ribose 1-methylphosphonate 5-triphosphate diphosphatase PhnM
MYFKDIEKHYKPHIHVKYNKHSAVVGLDGELLAGSLPVKQMKQVLAWITLREKELYKDWIKAVREQIPDKILP